MEGVAEETTEYLEAMDDPYCVRRFPWSPFTFTAEEKRKLEHIILLRYLAGWYHQAAEVRLRETGMKAEDWIRVMEQRMKIPTPDVELSFVKAIQTVVGTHPIPPGFQMIIRFDNNHRLNGIETIGPAK